MPSTAWSSGASSNTMLAALPPSSSVRALSEPATPRPILRPISVEPVNATLSTSGWVARCIPISPGPVTMLTVPGGRSAWTHDVGEQHRRERRGRGGLEHDRVAGGQRRGDLPGQHQQREVPRDDLGRDAERPGDPAREGVVELVRPAGVVPEVVRGERDVDVPALLDRLAGVHRFEDGELARRAPGGCARSGTGTWHAPGRTAGPTTGAAPGVRPAPPCRRRRRRARATSASGCSVDGSIEVNVSPPVAGTDRPPMNSPYRSLSVTMSRASGAGAYSHGIAWPSPNPQLLGRRSGLTATLVLGALGHGRHYVTARSGPPFSSRRWRAGRPARRSARGHGRHGRCTSASGPRG